MNNLAIVIPSLEPDERLLKLLDDIRENIGSTISIIVVNDGSSEEYDGIFNAAVENYQVILLKHQVNLGKGAALKTAIKYIVTNLPTVIGMITIDSDGQHLYSDVLKCGELFLKHPNDLVLGVRSFTKDIPFRSRFGNILTCKLLSGMANIKVSDSQTGLRVIPKYLMNELLDISGNRFEFELKMLFEAHKENIKIIEQPISTVYLEGNKSSHFKVISDSYLIYSTFIKYVFPSFFKYSLSSIVSFLVDIGSFTLCLALLGSNNLITITVSSTVARILSALVNYFVNRHLVFRGKSNFSFIKYGLIAVVQIAVSSLLVSAAHNLTMWNPTIIKVIVDSLLFFFSYHIQRNYIFQELKHEMD